MHTLGHDFIPEPIHAGGLRYHGMSPLVSLLKEHGLIEARSVHQRASFEAGVQFARAEGILPAPEPTHAIKVAIDEALAAKEAGEVRVILFNLCGHGHFDLAAYERYLDGTLEDYEYPAEGGRRAAALPGRLPTAECRRPPAADGPRSRMPKLACRVVRPPDLHGLTAGVAVRRRAALPALRRLLDAERRERRATPPLRRQNPPEDPGPPVETDERRVAERRVKTTPHGQRLGTRRAAGMRVALLGLGLIGGSIARALHGDRDGGWSVAAWTPNGMAPNVGRRRGDRSSSLRRRRPTRSPVPTSWSSLARRSPASRSSIELGGPLRGSVPRRRRRHRRRQHEGGHRGRGRPARPAVRRRPPDGRARGDRLPGRPTRACSGAGRGSSSRRTTRRRPMPTRSRASSRSPSDAAPGPCG